MNFSEKKHAFISQMLACSLVLVGIAGTAGVAVIWQRQLIVQAANRIKILQNNIAEVERHQMDVTSEIASEQSFDALTRLNASFNLGLAAATERQIVRVDASPEQRLATKRNAELYTVTTPAPAISAPTRIATR